MDPAVLASKVRLLVDAILMLKSLGVSAAMELDEADFRTLPAPNSPNNPELEKLNLCPNFNEAADDPYDRVSYVGFAGSTLDTRAGDTQADTQHTTTARLRSIYPDSVFTLTPSVFPSRKRKPIVPKTFWTSDRQAVMAWTLLDSTPPNFKTGTFS
ncbi:MAG: hypothetical protein ACLQU2_06160 [Candidatus Binataceae bacterium]